MVDRTYELERPAPPPPWKWMFDQHVVPAAIDVAGGAERSVLRGLEIARARPILVGLGLLACTALVPAILRRGAA